MAQKLSEIFPEPWLKIWAQAQAQGSGVAQETEHSTALTMKYPSLIVNHLMLTFSLILQTPI